MVFSGVVIACRLATCPTKRSPVFVNATTDGVVRLPSSLGMTLGSPPSITATTELVVPRSMPIILAIVGTSEIYECSVKRRVKMSLRSGLDTSSQRSLGSNNSDAGHFHDPADLAQLRWKMLEHFGNSLFQLLFVLFWFAAENVTSGTPPNQVFGIGVEQVHDECSLCVVFYGGSRIAESAPHPTVKSVEQRPQTWLGAGSSNRNDRNVSASRHL